MRVCLFDDAVQLSTRQQHRWTRVQSALMRASSRGLLTLLPNKPQNEAVVIVLPSAHALRLLNNPTLVPVCMDALIEEDEEEPRIEDIVERISATRKVMRECVICGTGFPRERDKEHVRQIVRSLGGTYSGSLVAKTTALVVASVPSDKYRSALEHGIAVRSPLWIEECWTHGKHVEPPPDAPLHPWMPALFAGWQVVIDEAAIAPGEAQRLRECVQQHGGAVAMADRLRDSRVTHLVTTSVHTDAFSAANRSMNFGDSINTPKVVLPSFLADFVASKGLLDVSDMKYMVIDKSESTFLSQMTARDSLDSDDAPSLVRPKKRQEQTTPTFRRFVQPSDPSPTAPLSPTQPVELLPITPPVESQKQEENAAVVSEKRDALDALAESVLMDGKELLRVLSRQQTAELRVPRRDHLDGSVVALIGFHAPSEEVKLLRAQTRASRSSGHSGDHSDGHSADGVDTWRVAQFLSTLVLSAGGFCSFNLCDLYKCTHVVLGPYACRAHVAGATAPLLTPAWLVQCHRQNRQVPCEAFRVSASDMPSAANDRRRLVLTELLKGAKAGNLAIEMRDLEASCVGGGGGGHMAIAPVENTVARAAFFSSDRADQSGHSAASRQSVLRSCADDYALQGEVPRSLLFRNYAFRLRLADAQARRSLRRRILAAGGHVLDGSTNEQVHFVVRETLSQHSAVNNLVHNNSVSGHTRSSFMQTTPPKEHPLQQEIRERRDAFRHAGVSLNATEVSAEQRVEIEHFLRRASLGRTRSVTPAWVDACLADNLVYAITESPLFVPLPHAAEAKRPQEGLLMTYSELAQSERRRVTKLAELLALPHESCFRSRSTSHVLAQQGTSKKVQSARKYSVPVVTWSWLYDSVLTQKVLPVLHYTLDLSTRAVRHTLPLLALASDVRDHRNRLSLARGQQQSDQPSDQYDQPSDQYDQDQIGLGGNDDDDLEKQPQPQQQDQQEHTLPLTVVEPPENSVVHVRDIIRHHAGTDTQASVTVDENSGTVNNARVKAPLNDSSVGFKRPRKRDDWPSQWSRTRVHVAGNKSQVEQMLRQLGARVLKHPTAKTIQFVVCDASLSLPKSLQLRVSTGEVRRRSVDWVRRACLAKGIVPPDQDEAKQEAKHEAKQEAKQEAKHEAKCEATQEQPLQREISCTFSRDEGPPPSKKRRVLQHSNSTQESKRTKQLRVLLSGFESTSGVRAQLRELPLHVVREAFLNDVSTCEQAKTFDMLVLARPLITAKLLLAIATRATIVSASWCTSALTTPKLPEAKDHLWQEDEKITRAIAARARKEALPLRGKRVACYALQNRREQLFRHLVAALGATVVTRDDLRRGDVLLFELSALSSESKRSNVRTAVLQQAHALGARLVDSECVQRWLMSPTASAGMPLRGLSVDDAARQMVPHT